MHDSDSEHGGDSGKSSASHDNDGITNNNNDDENNNNNNTSNDHNKSHRIFGHHDVINFKLPSATQLRKPLNSSPSKFMMSDILKKSPSLTSVSTPLSPSTPSNVLLDPYLHTKLNLFVQTR